MKCIVVKSNKPRNVFLMWPKGKQRDGGPVTSFQSRFSIFGNLSRHDDLVFQLWRQLFANMTHIRTYFVFGVSPLVLILVWWGPTRCSCGRSARSSRCIFRVRRSGWEKFSQKRPFFLELIMAGKMTEILLKTSQNSMACEILTVAVPL